MVITQFGKYTFSLIEIRAILSKRYEGKKYNPDAKPRDLIIQEIKNNYGSVDTIVYSLNGSPPKGYAIYSITTRTLMFFDEFWHQFKQYGEVNEIKNDLKNS